MSVELSVNDAKSKYSDDLIFKTIRLIFGRHLWLVFFNKWQRPFLPHEGTTLPEEKRFGQMTWQTENRLQDRIHISSVPFYIIYFS